MGFFDKLKTAFTKTTSALSHELRRIVTRSPRLTAESLEELEAALLRADLGMATTQQILQAVRVAFETQGKAGLEFVEVAAREVEKNLSSTTGTLTARPGELTVVSVVGVNGTGKTTTCAKLAHWVQQRGEPAVLAACDTFRAAAIEQLKLWGERLQVPVVAGAYQADPASVAHDAIAAAQSRGARWLFVDTAGRLHTKNNLMAELQKVHRVIGKKLPGAPHEVLLVLDGSTGLNALNQAREFNKAVPLTGLVITKLDGTSKGGAVVAIQQELSVPVKFIGVGEQPDDLQPFVAKEFADALFAVR
ncbi:MAG TPA: signal recognition particle-docking protein FtsY [Verrucomicrobiota bacterium]|nr:signal recognition particle-docking protein FtsY [Verrucomicrobiales bacterium]HRI13487.1 signal recognition particle-docking protein FtsY [Verrucomicrobiota bacterium]